MLEKHFNNDLEKNTLLAVSSSGYTNEQLALKWLIHFHNLTFKKIQGQYRMLIFDGHGSHCSSEFLWYCWSHKIIPFQLPPHSTHVLQLLDIGVFQPLKHWHQEAIHNKILYGDVSYSKVDFLNCYNTIRKRIFKKRTVLSAWKKSGLVPFKPEEVYARLVEFTQTEVMGTETS